MRKHLRIRTYLLILVLVSAVPFIGFAAMLVTHTAMSQTQAFGRDVLAVARALSLAIDSRVSVYQATLEVLAHSRALAADDMPAFYAEVQEAAALLDSRIVLSLPDGQQVLNTARPLGTALPRRARPDLVASVAATGRAVVSGVTRASLDGEPLITIDVPVARDGPDGPKVRYSLSSAFKVDPLEALLRSQRLPPKWVAGIVDRDGLFLARTRDNAARVGTPASVEWRAQMQAGPEAWAPVTTLDGLVSYTASVTSAATGWSVGIAVPRSVVWAPLLRTLGPLAVAGALLTLLAAGLAVLVARRIARPVVALARLGAAPEELGLAEAQEVAAALHAADQERRLAEAALRDREAELQMARELSPLAPWTADAEGRLLAVSNRISGLTGTLEKARWGTGWLDVVHPEDRAAILAAWQHSVGTGQGYDHSFRIRQRAGAAGEDAAGKDGAGTDWRWMRARAAPLLGADGRPTRWYGTTEDVDDRVRSRLALQVSEARLRVLTETLESQVLAEVAAREAVQAALHQSQRMEALGKLASGIAHDFNNVLQAVGGSLALILRAPADTARVQRMAALARDAVARGSAITGRMLSLARRADLHAGPVDASALLSDLQVVLDHTLGGGVRVEVDVPPGLPPLLADRGQLETVLINLATNARDAMPRGGTFLLSARLEDGAIRIEAADSGEGMAPDVLARAREPFYTTKPAGAGTGLGLALAHGFAEQSGGKLRIDSAPGHGTVVTLWLPLAVATLLPVLQAAG